MDRNPTLAQWQLAQELRRLRGDRKFSEVVKAARTTGGSLARWETPGDRGAVPGPAALERLLQIYGAEDQLERLLSFERKYGNKTDGSLWPRHSYGHTRISSLRRPRSSTTNPRSFLELPKPGVSLAR